MNGVQQQLWPFTVQENTEEGTQVSVPNPQPEAGSMSITREFSPELHEGSSQNTSVLRILYIVTYGLCVSSVYKTKEVHV